MSINQHNNNQQNNNVNITVMKQRGGQEGLPSVFTGNMMERDFAGKQPDWSPKVI